MESPTSVHEPRLRELLATETARQRRSYRRATFLIGAVALLGVAWLAFSAFNVIKLERRGIALRNESAQLEQRSSELQLDIDTKSQELKSKDVELVTKKQQLDEIDQMLSKGQTEDARQLVSIINERRLKGPDVPRPQGAPGFVGNYTYKGPGRTTITVEVIPDGALLENSTRPRTLYTYQITGEPTREATGPASFRVTLDRSKTVMLIFDFARDGAGGYSIKQSASAGRVSKSNFFVNPKVKTPGHQVILKFTVE